MTEPLTLTIGEKTYPTEKMRFKSLRKLLNRITSTDGGSPLDAQIDLALDLASASVIRNHPDMTREKIEEEMFSTELEGLLAAVPKILELNNFKLKQAEPGEAKAEGSTGATSTA